MNLSNPATDRLHGLDAVRGFALLLGVALHAAMSYLPGAEYFWIVADGDRSRLLAGGFFWIHSFRMTLFFLLAGYFGRLLLQRRGAGGFVRDRFKRIVIPLASFWFPVLMAIIAVISWNAWLVNGGSLPEAPPQAPLSVTNFPLTHLWFLYVLTIFYVAMLGVHGLCRLIDRKGRLASAFDAAFGRIAGPAAALLFALPATVVLATREGWWQWFGVPTPDMSLIPNVAALVAYGTAFAVGWALQRNPAWLAALARCWPLNLAVAVAATTACLVQIGLQSPAVAATPGAPETWAYAALYALSGWAWSLALIGLALRFLSAPSPVRRYLADASYWIYIVHVPIVMAAQVAASRFDAPWWVEYPISLGLGLALMVLSYHLLVRSTWLGGYVGGRRGPSSVASPLSGEARAPLDSATAPLR